MPEKNQFTKIEAKDYQIKKQGSSYYDPKTKKWKVRDISKEHNFNIV